MSDAFLDEIKKNVVLGHLDETDEGFDGDMEGQPGVMELVQKAIDQKIRTERLLETFSSAMEIVGQKFESGEYMIPDMLASAECVGDAMDFLEPYLKSEGEESKGTVIIATVKGDLHDIGKNIVVTMLKGAGYKVKDLGINIESEKIVEEVKESGADYLGLSALLTTTMVEMETVIDQLKDAGVRDKVKVLIGGAPTSPEFAEKIGADFHCRDAFAAVDNLKNRSSAA
jgi:5-methyltetrahydrofolate--homocysteine methyltransferase